MMRAACVASALLGQQTISTFRLRTASALISTNIRTGSSSRRTMVKRTAEEALKEENEPEHVPTSRDFVARYVGPPDEEMTDEQKKIRDEIVQTRPRTGLSGPFGPWLAVPVIAQPAQALGRACRYGTSLSFRESELVILLTGAKMKSHSEFDIHVGEAIKAGISMKIINALPRDDEFSLAAVKENVVPLLDNDRERAIAIFTAELIDTYTVSDETYAATKKAVEDKDAVLVEITSIAGYYTYVAYTLNVFKIPSK